MYEAPWLRAATCTSRRVPDMLKTIQRRLIATKAVGQVSDFTDIAAIIVAKAPETGLSERGSLRSIYLSRQSAPFHFDDEAVELGRWLAPVLAGTTC
jgi:hypothetical protein